MRVCSNARACLRKARAHAPARVRATLYTHSYLLSARAHFQKYRSRFETAARGILLKCALCSGARGTTDQQQHADDGTEQKFEAAIYSLEGSSLAFVALEAQTHSLPVFPFPIFPFPFTLPCFSSQHGLPVLERPSADGLAKCDLTALLPNLVGV